MVRGNLFDYFLVIKYYYLNQQRRRGEAVSAVPACVLDFHHWTRASECLAATSILVQPRASRAPGAGFREGCVVCVSYWEEHKFPNPYLE